MKKSIWSLYLAFFIFTLVSISFVINSNAQNENQTDISSQNQNAIEQEPKITIMSNSGYAGGIVVIDINVEASNLWGLNFKIEYDNCLSLIECTFPNKTTGNYYTHTDSPIKGITTITYNAEADLTQDAVITVKFQISDSASIGDYLLSITDLVAVTSNGRSLYLHINNGYIYVSTHEHALGEWKNSNLTHHTRSCFCGKSESAEHRWDYSFIETYPTVATEGLIIYTCGICPATMTETLPATGFPTYSESVPAIIIDNSYANPGKTVTVKIKIQNNPGIVSIKQLISYDTNVIELISVSDGIFTNTIYGPLNKTPFVINWIDTLSPDNNSNGTFATLIFRVKDNAPVGTYSITTTYDAEDIFNYNFENIAFSIVNGSITVTNYLPGDIDSNGVVNNKDVGLLMRYIVNNDIKVNEDAIDINRDGKVTVTDTITLMLYLCGKIDALN